MADYIVQEDGTSKLLLEDGSGSLLLELQPAGAGGPFNQTDWPSYSCRRRLLETASPANLLPLQLTPVARSIDLPLQARRPRVPEIPLPPNLLPLQDAGATVNYLFRGVTDTRIPPRRRIPAIDPAPNLLVLQGTTQAPFVATDLLPLARRKPVQVEAAVNFLPQQTPPSGVPAQPVDLPLLARRRIPALDIRVEFAPLQDVPVVPTDWPPIRRRRIAALDQPANLLPLATAPDTPNVPTDWPMPGRRRPVQSEIFVNLLPLTTPPQDVTTQTADWPSYSRSRRVPAIDFAPNLLPLASVAFVGPFTPTDWPMYSRPRRAAQSDIPVNRLPLLTPAAEAPVTKGWIPKVKRRRGHYKPEREPTPAEIRAELRRLLNEVVYGPPADALIIDAIPTVAERPLPANVRAQALVALDAVPVAILWDYGLEESVLAAVNLIQQLEDDDEEVIMVLAAIIGQELRA